MIELNNKTEMLDISKEDMTYSSKSLIIVIFIQNI